MKLTSPIVKYRKVGGGSCLATAACRQMHNNRHHCACASSIRQPLPCLQDWRESRWERPYYIGASGIVIWLGEISNIPATSTCDIGVTALPLRQSPAYKGANWIRETPAHKQASCSRSHLSQAGGGYGLFLASVGCMDLIQGGEEVDAGGARHLIVLNDADWLWCLSTDRPCVSRIT